MTFHSEVLYLAGPMTGMKDYNLPVFREVGALLKAAGYRVMAPTLVAAQYGTDRPYQFYMRKGVQMMLQADEVALLDGWTRSNGARFEVEVARKCGMPVRLAEEYLGRGAVAL